MIDRFVLFAASAGFALAAATGAAAAPVYRLTLIDPGPAIGDIMSPGEVRINAAGIVAGSVHLASDPRQRDWRLFRWTAAGGFEFSADKPWTGRSFVRHIDAAGRVTAMVEHDGPFGKVSAVTWDADGTLQRLPPGRVTAGNPQGDLLGRREAQRAAGILTAEGGRIRVGLDADRVEALNDARTVVGTVRRDTQNFMAVRWTQGGGVEELGYLPGASGNERVTTARAINAAGDIAGDGYSSGEDYEAYAFLWTAAGGIQRLPRAANCSTMSHEATGLDAARTVIGTVQIECPAGPQLGRAFAWTPSDGTKMLSDRIDPADPLRDQVILQSASAIDDAGRIVGWGIVGGRNLVYLLTPTAGR